jgi:uncharacterized protein YbaR (Trm112 family)
VRYERERAGGEGATPRPCYTGLMRHDLMEILVCPLCKGDLELAVTGESDGEITEGSLRCAACGETFPIEDGIPNMLPPDLRDA